MIEKACQSSSQSRGFSLMEILIVVGLLSLVGIVLASALTSAIDTNEQVSAISDRYDLIRQAMARMEREISMAYVSDHVSAREANVETAFIGTRDELTFVAFGNTFALSNLKQSDQRELSYFIGKDKHGAPALMRREQYNPDEDIEKGGNPETLCPHVKQVAFEYWDSQRRDWKERWKTTDQTSGRELPSRVRFTLTVELEKGLEKKFTSESKIWLTKAFKIG